MPNARFPDAFLWGAATSAYQIEGSPLADGAGPSIWQRFTHSPGLTANGDTGDIACDHYRRWRDDIALMRELGLNAYRFSISWSRILPEGTGRVNERGLDRAHGHVLAVGRLVRVVEVRSGIKNVHATLIRPAPIGIE